MIGQISHWSPQPGFERSAAQVKDEVRLNQSGFGVPSPCPLRAGQRLGGQEHIATA